MEADVAQLLSEVAPVPGCVASDSAALALALHCLMQHCGFQAHTPDPQLAQPGEHTQGQQGPGTAAGTHPTAAQHHYTFPNAQEWNWLYVAPGKAGVFTLAVSVHEGTGRVFVHGSESTNPANIHILGLQLERYMQPSTLKGAQTWGQVLVQQNTGALVQMVRQHIAHPLLAAAVLGITPAPAVLRPAAASSAAANGHSTSISQAHSSKTSSSSSRKQQGEPQHQGCQGASSWGTWLYGLLGDQAQCQGYWAVAGAATAAVAATAVMAVVLTQQRGRGGPLYRG